MSLSDIARLAGVQRPVVSMWRTRYSDPALPQGRRFPAPLDERGDRDAVLFKDEEVIAWLEATGRGNNTDVRVESALHDDRTARLTVDLDAASSLLLLQHLTGLPLSDITEDALFEALALANAPLALLDAGLLAESLTNAALVSDVEALAEAAFSAEGALAHLVPKAAASSGATPLAPSGHRLVAALLREVHAEADLPLVPLDARTLDLMARALPSADLGAQRHVTALAERLTSSVERAAWRLLIARGHRVVAPAAGPHESTPDLLPLPAGGCFAVTLLDATADQATAARTLDEMLLALGPLDRALVLGPASLLISAGGKKNRAALLGAADASGIALRYAARLPKGLEPLAGRRRLAVWLLAGHAAVGASARSVLADHGDATLDDAFLTTVAADVATVFSGSKEDIDAHAFRAGAPVPAADLHRRQELTPPSRGADLPVLGADLMRQVLENAPEIFTRLAPSAEQAPVEQRRVSWAQLTRRFGQDKAGVRIPPGELEDTGAGTVAAIGPEELRGTLPWEGRRIHRLRLEQIAPRARFTEPGDVVYVASGGPAARVDDVGGHLALTPARVFRPGDPVWADRERWAALAQIVAADIASQRVPDRDAWRIRITPHERGPDVRRAQREVASRRSDLEEELARLHRAETAMLDGLAAGALRLEGHSETDEQDEAAQAAKEEEA